MLRSRQLHKIVGSGSFRLDWILTLGYGLIDSVYDFGR